VGKNVLLRWINEFFQLNYTKIEQTASGVIHCQILDAVYPGKIPLSKVNFNAKHDYEYVQNFKVLQTVFTKEGISKHVPVDKLIKAKYQDNLEFCQWMKRFFDVKYGGQPYNAKERREQAMKSHGKAKPVPAGLAPAPKAVAKSVPAAAKKLPAKTRTPLVSKSTAVKPEKKSSIAYRPDGVHSGLAAPTAAKKPANKVGTAKGGAGTSDPKAYAMELEDKDGQIKALNEELGKVTVTVEGLEKERNFYFDKLREIEILCQTDDDQDSTLKQEILKILYATDENEEFQSPETVDPSATAGLEKEATLGGEETGGSGAVAVSEPTLLEENVEELLADLGDGHPRHTLDSEEPVSTF